MKKQPYGYIYCTTNNITGQTYIGKKNYTFRRKKKLTKKELSLLPSGKRRTRYKYVESESDWKTYLGSSERLKKDVQRYGKDNFSVKKLKDCFDKVSLSFWENYYQFKLKVLFKDTYNDNIAGRFFRGKIHK